MIQEMVGVSDDISTPTKPLKRQVSIINLMLVTISVGIAAILLTAVIMNPSLSPLASVHDSDGDGHADSADDFPDDPSEWSDSDGDGVGDFSDMFPNDVSEWNDADDDGYGDNSDEFPEDKNEWVDSDGDGVGDNSDEFPDNPDESADSDGDGVGDGEDEFPEDSSETSDSDGDGVGDNGDLFPDDPDRSAPIGEFDGNTDGNTSIYYFNEVFVHVINMSIDTSWNSISVLISDGYHDCTWEPSSDDLSHEPYEVWQYGSAILGDRIISLAIMDSSADGNMSAGDALWFTAHDEGLYYGTDYVISAIYEPTEGIIAEYAFNEEPPYCPYMSVSGEMLEDGVIFTILGISTEVIWSNFEVALSDAEDAVTWNMLSEDDLNDGPEDSQDYGSRALGDITVGLTVVDVDGDGYASVSDYFIFNTDFFEDDTLYTIAFIYKPLDEIMSNNQFTTDGTIITPTAQLTKSTIVDGVKLSFGPISIETLWSDISIIISDGTNFVAWTNITSSDLDGGTVIKHNFGSRTLGSLVVWLNVTDLAGNGYVNYGDALSLTADSFASATVYTVIVTYEPTASVMASISFIG